MTLSQNSKVDLFRALVYLLNTATDFIIALLLLAWKYVYVYVKTNYAERKSHTTLQPKTALTIETTLTPVTTSNISQEQDGGCEVEKILPINKRFFTDGNRVNKKHHSLSI